MTPKQRAAERALDYIEDGMTLGLGTGSTVAWTLQALGRRVQAGLRVRGVPTSRQTAALARELGIPLVDLSDVERLDLAVDGADEVDARLNLIKGGGGALLREKIVAAAADRLVIVVDDSKLVQRLGAFPLPVEVVPFGAAHVQRRVSTWAREVRVRMTGDTGDQPFVTDNGSWILDCAFDEIPAPAELERLLDAVPGVVETGLFVAMTDLVLVGSDEGVRVLEAPGGGPGGDR